MFEPLNIKTQVKQRKAASGILYRIFHIVKIYDPNLLFRGFTSHYTWCHRFAVRIRLNYQRIEFIIFIYLFQKKSLLKSLCKHSTSTASSTSFCCWQMAHWLLAYEESLFYLFYHRIFTLSFGDQILVHEICYISYASHIICGISLCRAYPFDKIFYTL